MSRPIAAALILTALVALTACKKAPGGNTAADQASAAPGNASVLNAPTTPPPATENAASANPDADFVTNAALSDMYEVQAGQYAQAHALSPAVRHFAAEMVKAHTETTNQLKGLLPDAGVQVTPPSVLDAQHQQMLDNLKSPGPTQFDRLYVSQQIKAHTDAVALFTAYSQKGANAPLTAWAAKTLPTIQHHLDMARKLQVDLK
jgi:putative membrane protein